METVAAFAMDDHDGQPTYDRLRNGMLYQVVNNRSLISNEVDLINLDAQDKKQLISSIPDQVAEDDNERFLRQLRHPTYRVEIEIPKIKVRFQNLSIEEDAYVGTRAFSTLWNFTANKFEAAIGFIGLFQPTERTVRILEGLSGIVRPKRMKLLSKSPNLGKTTSTKALAGKADDDLRVTREIDYCGGESDEFVLQRTSAYISRHDLIGFAPSAARFFKQLFAFVGFHQMAVSLFRFFGAAGSTQIVASTFGTFTLLLIIVLGDFIVAKGWTMEEVTFK